MIDSRIDSRIASLLDEVGVTTTMDARITGVDPVLATPFPVGEAAAAAIGACAATAAAIWAESSGETQEVVVDVRRAAASLVSFLLQRVDHPTMRLDTRTVAATTALYQAADERWVHLHGGFPHLAEGTLRVLGCPPSREAIAAAVRRWEAAALEEALAEARLCGAMVRTPEEWAVHPQAQAIAPFGRVSVTKLADGPPIAAADGNRPLGAVRALDLTRLLAGPTVARTIAEHGADVLVVSSRVVPNVVPFLVDTGHGKRSAALELDDAEDFATLRRLASEADVFVQNYRRGSLERRGFGAEELSDGHRGLVYVSVNCYGDAGPWADRGGWEQMAESVTGLCAGQRGDGVPQLVPAAVCDYVTGYLGALGTLAALYRRATEGGSYLVRASLCQTGRWVAGLGPVLDASGATGLGEWESFATVTDTEFGPLRHLLPVPELSRTPAHYASPPRPLGADAPAWRVA